MIFVPVLSFSTLPSKVSQKPRAVFSVCRACICPAGFFKSYIIPPPKVMSKVILKSGWPGNIGDDVVSFQEKQV